MREYILSQRRKKMAEKRKDFVYGALILTASGFLVKLIGALFRIPLTNLVGATAMGYFSTSYSIYEVFLAIATAGLPTGMAVMVSRSLALGKNRDIPKLVKIAGSVFVSAGLLLAVLGLIFARPLAVAMNGENAYYAVVALMPAVFFISIVALIKGYFQGFNNMVPTAISNLIEATGKLLIGYGIAYWMTSHSYPPEQAVGGAIAGITASTFFAMCFMVCRYLLRGGKFRAQINELTAAATQTPELAKEFFATALPIMISAITSNLMGAVDAFTVMNRLTGYMTENEANLLWGSYGNMTLTIFNLPSFVIVSLGTALVPGIAHAFAKNDTDNLKNTVNTALKYTMVLSAAFAFGMCAVSEPLLRLFYTDEAGIVKAAGLLQIASFVLLSSGFTTVTAAILNSVKKAHLSVIVVGVGAVVKSVFTYIFVTISSINIYGAPLATNIAYPVMLFLNLYLIRSFVGITPSIKEVFLKPVAAGILCFGTASLFKWLFGLFTSSRLAVIAVIILTGIVYAGIILLLRIVTVDEIKGLIRRKGKKSSDV